MSVGSSQAVTAVLLGGARNPVLWKGQDIRVLGPLSRNVWDGTLPIMTRPYFHFSAVTHGATKTAVVASATARFCSTSLRRLPGVARHTASTPMTASDASPNGSAYALA